MSIRTTNLNLVPVLQALLREASVSQAARAVSLSQPAVSGALAQLRDLLDDPLLVRVGRSMQLSPRAERLRPLVEQLCADLERLFEAEAFDPATASMSFVIAAPDHLAFLVSRVLLPRIRSEAPGVRIRFVDVPRDLVEPMTKGAIDLALAANFGLWEGLGYRSLLTERAVAVVSDRHPLARRSRVTRDDLARYPTVNYDTAWSSMHDERHPDTGTLFDWSPQLLVGQFTDAVLLALDPPVVAFAPAALAEHLAAVLPLRLLEVVGESNVLIDSGMFWAPLQEHAQEQIWLRSLVAECAAAIAPAESPRSGAERSARSSVPAVASTRRRR